MTNIIKGDSYRDRSYAILTPSRGLIHVEAYGSHLALIPAIGAKQLRVIVAGHEVARAYNELFKVALEHHAVYALTVEDDMVPQEDAIQRILNVIDTDGSGLDGVSALYRTKGEKGWPIVMGYPDRPTDATLRAPLEGQLMGVNVIPFGFAIWRMSMFQKMTFPWFETTQSTFDVNFCRKARANGFRFAVDCSLKVGHVDITDGKIY